MSVVPLTQTMLQVLVNLWQGKPIDARGGVHNKDLGRLVEALKALRMAGLIDNRNQLTQAGRDIAYVRVSSEDPT